GARLREPSNLVISSSTRLAAFPRESGGSMTRAARERQGDLPGARPRPRFRFRGPDRPGSGTDRGGTRGSALRAGPAGLGYRPMITVGCAGFPVPATRYFREFSFVEVQETHVSLPGPGTIRRWRREAPQGFRFALLGPREVGQEGFRDG